MPPGLRPAMMPSAPSATDLTAAASVTIENTMSAAAAAARGVGAKRIPALISGSALSLLRFQPVTVWPAAMSLGTMPAPMAPSPTNPMFIHSPRSERMLTGLREARSVDDDEQIGGRLGTRYRAPATHSTTI